MTAGHSPPAPPGLAGAGEAVWLPRLRWRRLRYVVLLLPLGLFLLDLPHQRFSLDNLERASNDLAAQVDTAAIRYQEGNDQHILALDVQDLDRAAHTPALRQGLDRRTARLRGQFVPGRDGRTFGLARLKMVCCAADVVPLVVLVVSEEAPPAVAAMDWVEVEGQIQFPPRRDGAGVLSVVVVPSDDKVRRVPPEANPYVR